MRWFFKNFPLDTLPTADEVKKAVKQLSCGKAPGPDAIPAEVYKAGGPATLQKLTELFKSMWKKGQVPQQLKYASLVHIYKRKGTASVVTITEASPSCPLLGKFWLASSATTFSNTLSKVCSQKPNVASALSEGRWT